MAVQLLPTLSFCSFRTFFFVPATLAFLTSLFIILYISTTSNLFSHASTNTLPPKPLSGSSLIFHPTHKFFSFPPENASTTSPEAGWRFDESRRSTGIPLSSIGMRLFYFMHTPLACSFVFLVFAMILRKSFYFYFYSISGKVF